MTKKIAFTFGETAIPSWPTSTPASSTPVTEPRLKLASLSLPSQCPRASVRKIASSGCSRNVVAIQRIALSKAEIVVTAVKQTRAGVRQKRRASTPRGLLAGDILHVKAKLPVQSRICCCRCDAAPGPPRPTTATLGKRARRRGRSRVLRSRSAAIGASPPTAAHGSIGASPQRMALPGDRLDTDELAVSAPDRDQTRERPLRRAP